MLKKNETVTFNRETYVILCLLFYSSTVSLKDVSVTIFKI